MKKEKLIAVILGAVTGLVLAGFILINISPKEKSQKEQEVTSLDLKKSKKEVVEPTVFPVKGVEIISPQNKSVVGEEKIEIEVRLPKDSLVVFVSPVFEKAVFSKEDRLKEKVNLALGENTIKILVFPKDPTISNLEKEILIYRVEKTL